MATLDQVRSDLRRISDKVSDLKTNVSKAAQKMSEAVKNQEDILARLKDAEARLAGSIPADALDEIAQEVGVINQNVDDATGILKNVLGE